MKASRTAYTFAVNIVVFLFIVIEKVNRVPFAAQHTAADVFEVSVTNSAALYLSVSERKCRAKAKFGTFFVLSLRTCHTQFGKCPTEQPTHE